MDIEEGLRALMGGLDPAVLHGSDAVAALERFSKIEKMAATGRMLMGKRVAETNAWKASGKPTAESFLASIAGCSLSEAHKMLGTAKKLGGCPRRRRRPGGVSCRRVRPVTSRMRRRWTRRRRSRCWVWPRRRRRRSCARRPVGVVMRRRRTTSGVMPGCATVGRCGRGPMMRGRRGCRGRICPRPVLRWGRSWPGTSRISSPRPAVPAGGSGVRPTPRMRSWMRCATRRRSGGASPSTTSPTKPTGMGPSTGTVRPNSR